MEENKQLLESLVDRATNYGKTCFELVKLRAVDKTSDVVSSVIPHALGLMHLATAPSHYCTLIPYKICCKQRGIKRDGFLKGNFCVR